MEEILLTNSKWKYDQNNPLGPEGGFGAVFAGLSKDHIEVAIKRLHISANEAAHRELEIAEKLRSRSLEYVLPILDSGIDQKSGRYYLVMPRAQKSLRDHLRLEGNLNETETIEIILNICFGLVEVNDIVHRDLKPGNVLYSDDRWKIADFGIARFVEKSTSLRTVKQFLSAAYAAPEQWRFEHATSATDIYALGIITYELLKGNTPFSGPTIEDFKHQHLSLLPPHLNNIEPIFGHLIVMMMRKVPESRPNLDRVIRVLSKLTAGQVKLYGLGNGFTALAKIGHKDYGKDFQKDTKLFQVKIEEQARLELKSVGIGLFKDLSRSIIDRLLHLVPSIQLIFEDGYDFYMRMESASLEIGLLNNGELIPNNLLIHPSWDVMLGGYIKVIQRKSSRVERGSNLWFTDVGNKNQYRWWEVNHCENLPIKTEQPIRPLLITSLTDIEEGELFEPSYFPFIKEPTPFDDEDFNNFCDKWFSLLADAFMGTLD